MVSAPSFPRRVAVVIAYLVAAFCGVAAASAQTQEGGTLDRILKPDRTLQYSPADKQFAVSSTVADRQVTVKPFAFSHGANLRAGDGAFSTRVFTPKDKFQTQAFSTRAASSKSFTQTDKTFGTKSMDVKEDRAANKAMPIGEYVPGERTFLGRGKRQETIDDLRKQKNLTVDQVRELLNKNK